MRFPLSRLLRYGIAALLALAISNCTMDARMRHIRRNAITEPQWYRRSALAARQPVVPKKTEPVPVAAPPRERIIIAVMDIQDTSGNVDGVYLQNALEMLRGKLSATGHFIVIDKSRQQEKLKNLVLDQKKESYKECYDQGCQIPLGQALAADSILRTTISCLGTSCVLSSELVDLEKEATVSGGTSDFENQPAELKKAIDVVVEQLTQRWLQH